MSQTPRIVVVGAGAAGMMAAVCAARSGASVVLLERQERVGRKLLATGNGRCNITNLSCLPDQFLGVDPSFVVSALRQVSVAETIEFFEAIGLCTRVEEQGRVYPISGQASSVLDVLRFEIERLAIAVRESTEVTGIASRAGRFTVKWRDGQMDADRVIVTTGGRAAPNLGGSDSGVSVLARLGHSVVPVHPGLVPLKTEPHFGPRVKGVRAAAVITLVVDGAPVHREEGEVQFTDYGLSGIAVMNASLTAGGAVSGGAPVAMVVDLIPEWSLERLEQHIARRFEHSPDRRVDTALVGLVHKRLIGPILDTLSIKTGVPCGRLPLGQCRRIAHLLKQWHFRVTGTLSWREAQVMCGGIRTDEFSGETLESCLAPGLFAAGEILDVVGECGGRNLQWAWSSGRVAALNAARL